MDYRQKPPVKVWRDATLQMGVKVDGIWHQSKEVTIKVKGANPKKEPPKKAP